METTCDMMELCRLCLVKDEVNTPIFEEKGEIRQIFLKISSCLPVKVSREDKLPKKICDGCSCKLDMLYEFCNTSANAEKQLLTWLGQAGINANNTKTTDETMSAVVQMSNKPHETIVKQETIDTSDKEIEEGEETKHVSDPAYMFEQNFSFDDQASSSAGPSAHTNSDEPPPKRAKRAAALRALPITTETDEEDEDDVDAMEPLTKIEGESEESEGEDAEPSFVDAPSTSADDQPGPSGVGKGNIDAPDDRIIFIYELDSDDDSSKNTEGQFLNDQGVLQSQENGTVKDQKIVKERAQFLDESSSKTKEMVAKSVPKNGINVTAEAINEPEIYVEEESSEVSKESLSPNDKEETIKIQILDSDDEEFSADICEKPISQNGRSEEQKPIEIVEKHTYVYDRGQKMYICNTCLAEYEDVEAIEKHIKTHGNIFKCVICLEKFTKPYNFGIHMTESHNNDEIYRCPLCDYAQPLKAEFFLHINKNHMEKYPYTCDICDKGFNSSTILKEHKYKHLGIKSLFCIVCSKAFMSSQYLKTHQTKNHKVGFDGIASRCKVCSRKFVKLSNLEKHMEKCIRPVKTPCEICKQGFYTYFDLETHYGQVHMGDKLYPCDKCKQRFTSKRSLLLHEKLHNRTASLEEDKETHT